MIENKREKIIESAIKLFTEKGFDGTSTRDISRCAGANISMIAYYFGGKEGLLNAIIEDLFQKQEIFITRFNSTTGYEKLSREKKAEAFLCFLEELAAFFYSEVPDALMSLFAREQHRLKDLSVPPLMRAMRKMLSDVLQKDENSKEIIFKSVFIASQINSPRIMKLFMKPYGDSGFENDEIEFIKNNVKEYSKMLFKEAGISL